MKKKCPVQTPWPWRIVIDCDQMRRIVVIDGEAHAETCKDRPHWEPDLDVTDRQMETILIDAQLWFLAALNQVAAPLDATAPLPF